MARVGGAARVSEVFTTKSCFFISENVEGSFRSIRVEGGMGRFARAWRALPSRFR